MKKKTWTVIDQAAGQRLEERSITPADVGGTAKGYKITTRTLHGGLSEGVDAIRIDNGTLAFEVIPTRGMGLWKAWHAGEEIGWKSPVRGPVHPQFVPVTEPSGLGWLDGFDELLVRCGLESNGAPEFDERGQLTYPLHGRIANKPAHHVEIEVDGETGLLQVTGAVEETRFHFFKARMTSSLRTVAGSSALTLIDRIENLSGSPAEIQILYHANFGAPLLDAGAQVVVPAKQVVPRNAHAANAVSSWSTYGAPEAGSEERVYFLKLAADDAGQTRVLLKNAHGTRGVGLLYPEKQLPCFTIWKNPTDLRDGYVTGLEPGTNFPNPRSFEGKQGRVVSIEPGGSFTFELTLESYGDAAAVANAEAAVAKLSPSNPVVSEKPQPGWCSDA